MSIELTIENNTGITIYYYVDGNSGHVPPNKPPQNLYPSASATSAYFSSTSIARPTRHALAIPFQGTSSIVLTKV